MEYHATYYIYIALQHFINELCTLDTVGHEALQFDVSSCRVEYAVFFFRAQEVHVPFQAGQLLRI